MPGLGVDWFGDDFRLDGWLESEKWTYLGVEVIPLALFVLVGVLFCVSGSRTREDLVAAEEIAAAEIV